MRSRRYAANSIRLSLESERLDRLDLDLVLSELERLPAEQDLAGGGRLLETCGDIDRIARREPLPRRRLTCHHLAGVDTKPRFEANAELALELRVQEFELLTHLRCGTQRAPSVILVEGGDAEDGHDRVADELLHRPAVALEDALHLFEVP